MSFLISACTDPITNITGPIYHLVRGDLDRCDRFQKTKALLLAIFRTVTAAAFFFMIIPFNYIFGHQDNLSRSFAFTAQFLIHPYAAALFNAFMNGGHPLVMKVIDLFVKRELLFTRADAGGFVNAIAFCYVAQLINHIDIEYALDNKYIEWSYQITYWLCRKPN